MSRPLAFLMALVVWLSSTSGPAALDDPTAAALEYVSDEAQVVAYANVRALMASPLADRVRQLNDARGGIERLEQWTGVSVARDVDDVVFAGQDASAGDAGQPLLMLRGRFDSDRVEAYTRDRGARVERYRGVPLVLAPRRAGDAAIALPTSDLALLGDAASVRRALDAKVGAARAITDNAGFMTAVAGLDGSAAWSVATFDAVTARTALPAEVAAQLPPIDWLAVSGRFEPVAQGELLAAAHDEQAAQNLREVVRGFLALARMQGGRSRELRGALESVTLGGDGTTVSLSVDLTPALLDVIDSNGLWRLALPWLP